MSRVLKAVNWVLDGIITGTGFLGIVILLVLSLFILFVVLARFVAAINIPGFFDTAMYVLIIFPFATAAYTLREGRHIVVDVITERLPERTRAGLNLVIYPAASIFVIVLGWQAADWTYELFTSRALTSAVWQIPKWILAVFIAFGSFLIIPQIIRIVVESIRTLARPGVAGEGPPRLRHNPLLYIVIFIIGFASGVLLFTSNHPVAGLLLILLICLFLGMPVLFAMGLVGLTGVYLLIGPRALIQLPLTSFNALHSFPLSCLPLFILGGLIFEQGKIAEDLFAFFAILSRRFPASLLVATIAVGGVFCALSGSSVGTTAVITAVAAPILMSRGYNKALACGTIGGATIGTIIPPSIGFVVYGVITETSIAELFMAAVIPGAIIFGLYFLYVIMRAIVSKKSLFEGGQIPTEIIEKTSRKEVMAAARKAIWGLLAPVIVLGGIYAGTFTPTEGAAVLVLYSTIVTVFITRTVKFREIPRVTLKGAELSGAILGIIFCAYILALPASQLRISTGLVNFAEAAGLQADALLLFLFVLLLVFGLFMDGASVKVITLPIFFPVAKALGVNVLWLGIFYQVMGEIGLLTPPVGLNLYVIRGISGVSMTTVIRGCLPFVFIMAVALLILYLFPETVTWLPSTMHY